VNRLLKEGADSVATTEPLTVSNLSGLDFVSVKIRPVPYLVNDKIERMIGE
jgi:hypothetical protein